jgi:hypothetical protein
MRSKLTTTLVAFAALATVPAYAQSVNVQVTVPFEFTAGQNVLPAGDYMIQNIISVASGTARIESRDLASGATVLTRMVTRDTDLDKSMLVFNRYGNAYFLSRVWLAGSMLGLELPRTRAEAELARTALVHRPEQVILLASR